MLNFTVGPVMSSEIVREIGSEQVPYFRTDDFSKIVKECEKKILEFAQAPLESRAIFMTCSSTGSMEAAVMNCFSEKDKVLVINGGSFGHRFAELCDIHGLQFEEIRLRPGEGLTQAKLELYNDSGYTGLLVNVDETSTGVLYDTEMIGDFCKRNSMFYVCDCVSSFLADSFNMKACGADIMITGSQKALACPPGISIIVVSPRAIKRINEAKVQSMYFNLQSALKNGERGQTPFTPAVGIIRQIHARLIEISEAGGVEAETYRISQLARDFRERIKGMPFELLAENPANGVTALKTGDTDAENIFKVLKDEYNMWICPNGGELSHTVFRVGHLGSLSIDDNRKLVEALKDMQKRGIIH